MKEIPLRNRAREIVAYTLVDDEDYEFLSQWRWHCYNNRGRSYARRSSYSHPTGTGKRKHEHVHMHRVILNLTKNMQADHINKNTLDNRRSNLRGATPQENTRNTRPRPNSTSSYKGVHWHKASGKWAAAICIVKGKTHHIGVFENEADAAKAYDELARLHHREFATLNFPGGVL